MEKKDCWSVCITTLQKYLTIFGFGFAIFQKIQVPKHKTYTKQFVLSKVWKKVNKNTCETNVRVQGVQVLYHYCHK